MALLARRAALLEEVAGQIRAAGGMARAWPVDLLDSAALRQAVAEAHAHFGRLDVVVCAAGTNLPQRALAVLDPADWERLLRVNLTAAFHLTQAALLPQGGGLLIHIASYAVQRPDLSGVAYQASKHGLVGLAHGTWEERSAGIRTTVIFPGMTDTPLLEQRPVPPPPEVRAKALRPEDVAAACLFVATLPPRVRVPELVLVPSAL